MTGVPNPAFNNSSKFQSLKPKLTVSAAGNQKITEPLNVIF